MKSFLQSLFAPVEEPATVTERVVGVDVGSSSIKVVELTNSERGPIVKTYGEIQLGSYGNKPPGMPVELSNERLSHAFVDVLREAGVSAHTSVLAVPLAAGFVTIVPISVKADEEIAQQVPIIAPKYIPVPLADVTLDWLALSTPEADPAQQEILLVALQNESIANYSSMLTMASLPTHPIELEIFSAIRGVGAGSEETCVIIDIGAASSKLYIVHNGALVRIHRAPFGGAAITQKITVSLDCSFIEAENIKRSVNQTEEEKKACIQATMTVLQAPLQEFKRVIDQYEQRTKLSISRMVLTGGVAASAHIEAYINDVLQRQVVEAQPFNKVGYPAVLADRIETIGPVFTNSIGAALRQLTP